MNVADATLTDQTYQDWLDKMNGIYEGIADRSPFTNGGTQPDGSGGPVSGILVSFGLPLPVLDRLQDFSFTVAECGPGVMTYEVPSLHSTIGDGFPKPPADGRPLLHEDPALQRTFWRERTRPVVAAAQAAVDSLPRATKHAAELLLSGALADRGSVIVPGTPNEAMFGVRSAIVRTVIQAVGPDAFRGGWGSHVTVARFREPWSQDGPELSLLRQLLQDQSVHLACQPRVVRVSVLSADGTTFSRNDVVTIPLN